MSSNKKWWVGSVLCAAALMGIVPACATPRADIAAIEDGESDGFVHADEKTDTTGIEEGSPEARGVLRVANTVEEDVLLEEIGLSERVVDNMVRYKLGDDERVGGDDDEAFDTLQELDAIPYVGARAFGAMLDYARARGWTAGDNDDPPPPPADVVLEPLFTPGVDPTDGSALIPVDRRLLSDGISRFMTPSARETALGRFERIHFAQACHTDTGCGPARIVDPPAGGRSGGYVIAKLKSSGYLYNYPPASSSARRTIYALSLVEGVDCGERDGRHDTPCQGTDSERDWFGLACDLVIEDEHRAPQGTRTVPERKYVTCRHHTPEPLVTSALDRFIDLDTVHLLGASNRWTRNELRYSGAELWLVHSMSVDPATNFPLRWGPAYGSYERRGFAVMIQMPAETSTIQPWTRGATYADPRTRVGYFLPERAASFADATRACAALGGLLAPIDPGTGSLPPSAARLGLELTSSRPWWVGQSPLGRGCTVWSSASSDLDDVACEAPHAFACMLGDPQRDPNSL